MTSWAQYVAWLVDQHGSLAKVATKASRDRRDAARVERALARLRTGKARAGGPLGQRLLRAFGLPKPAAERLRWMGSLHSRFNELPVEVCLEQLQAWSRPPLSESEHRVWLSLGLAGCALRQGELRLAARHLADAAQVTAAPVEARLELGLLQAQVAARRDEEPDLLALAPLVREANEPCLTARWLDQGALGRSTVEARALYEQIRPVAPFARCKRSAGLAYVAWQEGRLDQARAHAQDAISAAGDGGHTRLRLMYLGLLAHIEGGEVGEQLRARAVKAARELAEPRLAEQLEGLGHHEPEPKDRPRRSGAHPPSEEPPSGKPASGSVTVASTYGGGSKSPVRRPV